MKPSKKLGRCICGLMMIFVVSFSTMRYLSFDANSEESATLESSTFAPAESDILQSGATEVIYTIVNGNMGAKDPNRQGLDSALNGEGPSLDILAHFTEISAGYSPMWDVRLAEWTKVAISKDQRKLITDGDDLEAKSASGLLVSPAGGLPTVCQEVLSWSGQGRVEGGAGLQHGAGDVEEAIGH